MKIILLKDVPKIGKKFDVKDIADGYAQNFIIPRGLGVKATPAELAKIDKMKEARAVDNKIQEDLLRKNIEALESKHIVITAKANDKGHLFAGIGKEDLVAEIQKQTRIEVDADLIDLPKPLREVGNFLVDVVSSVKKGHIKVEIKAE